MLIFSLYMFATTFSDMRTLAPTILYIFTYWIKSQVCQQPPTTVDALSGPPSHLAKDQRDIPILLRPLYFMPDYCYCHTDTLSHWDPTEIPGCCRCLPMCDIVFILPRLQHHFCHPSTPCAQMVASLCLTSTTCTCLGQDPGYILSLLSSRNLIFVLLLI